MNARQAALDVLSGVLKKRSFLNLELKKVLNKKMTGEDKRFVTALASTTIENLYRIDYVINRFSTAKRIHTIVRNILRLGVAQLLFFESVPSSAAVNESVKLAVSNGKASLKGFVNAVLRNVSQNLGNISYPSQDDFPNYLHVMYSFPLWLCKKYVLDYGAVQAENIMSYIADNSLTCVRLKDTQDKEFLNNYLPGKYCSDAFYIKNASDIENMPLFKNGRLIVQGESSMITVRAAGIAQGDLVLDTCAAPGGKSIYAAQIASQGKIMAFDLHSHRVELMKKNIERMKISNITVDVADSTLYNPEWESFFDVLIIDAPCSALGLTHRKPDIKILRNEADIAPLIEIQRALLNNCSRYVKPGGKLLYSTCTINRNENEENVRWFLDNNSNFNTDDFKNDIPEALMYRVKDGMMQLLPNIDGIDGFFMARLKRI